MGETPIAATLPGLLRRAHDLVAGGRRGPLGIVGAPGAGASRSSDALAERLRDHPQPGPDAAGSPRSPWTATTSPTPSSSASDAWDARGRRTRSTPRGTQPCSRASPTTCPRSGTSSAVSRSACGDSWRHQRFGEPVRAASEWAHGVDQRDTDVVATSARAELRVDGDVVARTGVPDGTRDAVAR